MATNKVYVGDSGTEIILDTLVDLSTATKVSIKVRRPNGAVTEWVGTVFETTKVRYVTQPGDLSVKGPHLLQAYAEMPVWIGRGETVELEVSEHYT